MADIELISRLSPEECVARLRADLHRPGLDVMFRGALVSGRVSGRVVRVHKRIFHRNSFQTFLTGRLTPHGSETLLQCSLGMHPGIRAVMLLGQALCLVVAAIGTVVVLGRLWAGLWTPQDLLPVFVPIGICLFLRALIWSGRLDARGEGQYLIDYLAQAVDAQPLPEGPKL